MENFRKTIVTLTIAAALLPLGGCGNSSESCTFETSTGEHVEVDLASGSGLDLRKRAGRFAVVKDGNTLMDGMFVEPEYLPGTGKAAKADPKADVREQTDQYLYYCYESESGNEQERVVLVSDETAVALGSRADAQTAAEIYDLLSFNIEE